MEATKEQHEAEHPICTECRAAFRALVSDYAGCEVFAIGTCGESGIVEEIDPIAFGNWEAVPAPAQDAQPGQVLIHNHPSGDLQPSGADISVASLYGKSGLGFYIVDNECERIRVVVNPFRPKSDEPLAVGEIEGLFGEQSPLADTMPGFEARPQQVAMAGFVARAFNEGRVAVVEAGTGTGKSFAYLAPAIKWATSNKKRVVVSTNTINLQEQLIGKDLPDIRAKLGMDFKAVLLKGRSNYVSLRRLKFATGQGGLLPDERQQELGHILEWSKKTTDGSRSDLSYTINEDVWEAAQSDKDDCLRARCPTFNECFYYKSRREAASADIIVANHHLVMADIALKKDNSGKDFTAIIPPHERVIFDEAHHVEAVATEYFSMETSLLAIRRQLMKLSTPHESRGALPRLNGEIFTADSGGIYPQTRQILRHYNEEFSPMRLQVEAALALRFDELCQSTMDYFNIRELGARERRELRIARQVAASPYWSEATETLEDIATELATFLAPVGKILNLVKLYPEEVVRELADARLNAAAAHTKLEEHHAAIRHFLRASDDEYCRWFEVSTFRDRPVIRPCAAPLDVSKHLRTALFAKKKAIVLTSATLTVGRKFDYLSRQLGLQPVEEQNGHGENADNLPSVDVSARCDYLVLDTPFDYARNCLLGVTLDTISPADGNYELATAPVIAEALAISEGRAFVLFTSYRSLEKSYNLLQRQLITGGLVPLRQGEMPRHKLLDVFRRTSRSVLFATSSFWEGVDVQGRALECLILTKLPFAVPTTPIFEARTERIDRNGGNSFAELALPLAVIKFKQGFGRLIRSKSDRGMVLVLDHRIVTKEYGKVFLASLPPVGKIVGGAEEVLKAFDLFYNENEQINAV